MSDLPPKYCPCGNLIIRQSYDTPDQFAKKYNEGYCRAKCRRLYHPPKPDRPHSTLSLLHPPNYKVEDKEPRWKEAPERDAARLAYARSMPCLKCGAIEGTHAHHEQEEGHGVMGGKVSDRRTVSLCPKCHFDRHNQGRSFWGNIDSEGAIRNINAAYDNRKHQP